MCGRLEDVKVAEHYPGYCPLVAKTKFRSRNSSTVVAKSPVCASRKLNALRCVDAAILPHANVDSVRVTCRILLVTCVFFFGFVVDRETVTGWLYTWCDISFTFALYFFLIIKI